MVSVVDLLREQHAAILHALAAGRGAGADQAAAALDAHEAAKVAAVYPVAARTGTPGARLVQELTAESEALRAGGGDSVEERTAAHFEREESELIPMLERFSDQEELAKMAAALEAAIRLGAPDAPMGHEPTPEHGVGPSAAIISHVQDPAAG
jgi:hypothetical protein